MKPISPIISVILAITPLASVSQAAITYNDPYFQSIDPVVQGTGYTWNVELGASGFETTVGLGEATDVGVWSWRQSTGATYGWTHTSDWAVLTLTEAASLTIVMGGNSSIPDPMTDGATMLPTDKLMPSFSIWYGTYAYAEWSTKHTYSNTTDISWAAGISGIAGYVDNSTEDTASLTIDLPAGVYTIALGSNNPSGNSSSDPTQGYYATFATSPIPEPSIAMLGAAALGMSSFRRRRAGASA
jgi:hypothetical protein